MQRILYGLESYDNLNVNNTYSVKLENLHSNPYSVMKNFTSIYNIEFNKCLLESTYHNKKWWGDIISKKYLDGFNPNISKPNWHFHLSFIDKLILEIILKDKIIHYSYDLKKRNAIINFMLFILLHLFPTKYEINLFKHIIQSRKKFKKIIKEILLLKMYYFKRIIIFQKIYFKSLFSKNIYPNII